MHAPAPGERRPGRVALFSTNFLEYSQTFVYDEVRAHDRYAVEVFSSRRLNADRFPFEPVHTPSARGYGLYKATTLCPAFDRRLRAGGFDLIHAHFGPGAVYALPYALRHRLPLVVTFHGYDVPVLLGSDVYKPEYWRYGLAWRVLRRRIDRFLAASLDLRDLLLRLGAPPERVHLYHLGVDVPTYRREPAARDHVEILMIGRFVEKKGHEYALRAFAQVARRPAASAPVRLVFLGDGEREGAMRALAAELGVADRVEFAGAVPHKEVARRLAATDVVMAPSVTAANGDRESGILVLKEAGASSLPVIGTYHGGLPEIVDDGRTGFLVAERDVDALADRLARLVDAPTLRAEMGLAGRRKMEVEYDLHTQVRRDLAGHYDAVRATAAPADRAFRSS